MDSDTGSQDFDVARFARQFDHHAPEYGEHLYEIYSHMRAQCPVVHTDAHEGFWVLTRYEDIMRVARDDETFSVEAGIIIPTNRIPGERPFTIPADYDPPRSKAFRRILDPLVTPKAIAATEPMLRTLARELVDGFVETGEADLVQDLAVPLTAIATLRISGLPDDNWPKYVSERRQGNVIAADTRTEMMRMKERSAWTRDAILEQTQVQRKAPVDGGLLTHLLTAEIDGRRLEDWEIQAVMFNFVAGGLDTTQALLGSSWVHLGRHRDQLDALRSDMSLLGNAIEEMLRYFAPQQALSRIATRDVEVGGVEIKKGEKLLMCWASANRDEAEFENPEAFDLRRSVNRHMSFGVGTHRCMGSNLTRLEARVCLEEVLNRLPDYRLVEDGVVRFPDVSSMYGYAAVPVTFTPGEKIAG